MRRCEGRRSCVGPEGASSFRGAGAKRRRTRNPITGFRVLDLGLRPTISPRNDHGYVLTCAHLSAPVSERDQLLGKQPPLKPTVDFHPIIVRLEQKLTSGLCRNERVPTKLKGKLYDLGEVLGLVKLELMSRRVTLFARRHRRYRSHRSFAAISLFQPSPVTQNKKSTVARLNSPMDAVIRFASPE